MKKNIWQIRLVVTMFIVGCQSLIGTSPGSGVQVKLGVSVQVSGVSKQMRWGQKTEFR
jgi:hypothetical protein